MNTPAIRKRLSQGNRQVNNAEAAFRSSSLELAASTSWLCRAIPLHIGTLQFRLHIVKTDSGEVQIVGSTITVTLF